MYSDRFGLFAPAIAAYCATPPGAVVCAAAAKAAVHTVGVSVTTILAWWGVNAISDDEDSVEPESCPTGSDTELQQTIAQEANRREYKNICGEQDPSNLSKCELAKWRLNKAINCKAAREENTRRWWDGKDTKHNPALHSDLNNQLDKAIRLVNKECR